MSTTCTGAASRSSSSARPTSMTSLSCRSRSRCTRMHPSRSFAPRCKTPSPHRSACKRSTCSTARTLDVGAPAETLRFYKHGWQSWSPTLVLDCAGEDVAVQPPVIGAGHRARRLPRAIHLGPRHGNRRSGRPTTALVAGFISAADQFSHVWFDRDGVRAQRSLVGRRHRSRAARTCSPRNACTCSRPTHPARALERYGTRPGARDGGAAERSRHQRLVQLVLLLPGDQRGRGAWPTSSSWRSTATSCRSSTSRSTTDTSRRSATG